jgi:DNA-binding GntR family transcriptional regulator
MAEAVAGQLRASIIAGDLEAGARLLQEELAERLAVSRAPVREALAQLEREGLVKADRWRGSVVAPLDVPHIREVYEFRGVVERFVAETLARRDDFDVAPWRSIIEAGRAAVNGGDLNRLIELDLRFHTRLYEAVGNKVLSAVMEDQWTHTRRVMSATLKLRGYPQTAWDEHAGIIDAIVSHDSVKAGQRAADHMTAASTRMVETFARHASVEPESTVRDPRRPRPVSRGARR